MVRAALVRFDELYFGIFVPHGSAGCPPSSPSEFYADRRQAIGPSARRPPDCKRHSARTEQHRHLITFRQRRCWY